MIPFTEIGKNLHGELIAAGRGSFIYDESGKAGHFEFLNSRYFRWTVSLQRLEAMGIKDEDDLYDCIEQAEKDIKDLDKVKLANNMPPLGGYKNIGMAWRSKKNPSIVCVMAPTDLDPKYADWDSYFEWYYQPQPSIEAEKTDDFLKKFDKMVEDPVTKNVLVSPVIVPSYYEAVDYLDSSLIEESRKEAFLGRLWNYSKGLFSKAYGDVERKALLDEWKSLYREANDKKYDSLIESVLAEENTLEESKKK